MPLKQITQDNLRTVNIAPGPWFVGIEKRDGIERELLTNASGDRVIAATTHHMDNHPDLSSQGGELKLATASPDLLVSLVNIMLCLQPAEYDFSELERKAFDEAIGVVNQAGAEGLLTAWTDLVTQDNLREIGLKQGPWLLATGCSWRRILTGASLEQVLLPGFPEKGLQKLVCRDEDLLLISSAPEILVALINLLSVWMPYATDFNEEEQAVFDAAIEAVERAGAMRLLNATLEI